MISREWLTPPEVAEILEVDQRTIRRYFEEGRFHGAQRSASGRIYIPRDCLVGWRIVPQETHSEDADLQRK